MLEKKLEKAINQQINTELSASYNYLAMAAWFDKLHLDGFAAFMQRQSNDEQVHAHKLFRFVLDRDGDVNLEPIAKPKADYKSAADVFKASLTQEQANTKAIYDLYDLARELKDYATTSHLQWFLDEQVEEEKLMTDVLGRLKLAGDDRAALLVLDAQVPKMGIDAEGGKH